MKTFNLFFLFSLIATYFLGVALAQSAEKFYTVTVKNPSEDKAEIDEFLTTLSEKIHDIIANNLDSYQDPSKLEELQKNHEANNEYYVKKYGKYGYILRMTTRGENSFLNVYLNSKTAGMVIKLKNVTAINIPYMEESQDPEPEPEQPTKEVKCKAQAIGYPCCSPDNTKVEYQDETGDWGLENGEWCGITLEEVEEEVKEKEVCFAEALGYSCCAGCKVEYTDDSGEWGIEDGVWCGILKSKC